MRESAAKRYAYAALFALVAGLLVSFGNPMDHVKADLRADTQGVRFSFEVAAEAIEKVCTNPVGSERAFNHRGLMVAIRSIASE